MLYIKPGVGVDLGDGELTRTPATGFPFESVTVAVGHAAPDDAGTAAYRERHRAHRCDRGKGEAAGIPVSVISAVAGHRESERQSRG